MRTGHLCSSSGTVTFDADTGLVTETDLDKDFGAAPFWVNVPEWKRRYPEEHDILPSDHDILDFGYVDVNGVYDPPAEDWRKDREEGLL